MPTMSKPMMSHLHHCTTPIDSGGREGGVNLPNIIFANKIWEGVIYVAATSRLIVMYMYGREGGAIIFGSAVVQTHHERGRDKLEWNTTSLRINMICSRYSLGYGFPIPPDACN